MTGREVAHDHVRLPQPEAPAGGIAVVGLDRRHERVRIELRDRRASAPRRSGRRHPCAGTPRPSSCAHQTTLRTLIELRRPQIRSGSRGSPSSIAIARSVVRRRPLWQAAREHDASAESSQLARMRRWPPPSPPSSTPPPRAAATSSRLAKRDAIAALPARRRARRGRDRRRLALGRDPPGPDRRRLVDAVGAARRDPRATPSLTLREVDAAFADVAATAGKGSAAARSATARARSSRAPPPPSRTSSCACSSASCARARSRA